MSIIKKECVYYHYKKQVDSGVNFEDVNINVKLSVLKPISRIYKICTNAHGSVHVLKGWGKLE